MFKLGKERYPKTGIILNKTAKQEINQKLKAASNIKKIDFHNMLKNKMFMLLKCVVQEFH